jgi:DNA (cytosine-5)-methyltransferase 1
VLNSKHFGLAQSRHRVYIVGHLRGTVRPEVFPLQSKETKPHLPKKQITKLLPSVKIREATIDGYTTAKMGDSIDVAYPNSQTKRGRVMRQLSHTLITGMQIYTLAKNKNLRRLTPLECERLQGFPDGWTKQGIDVNGNTVNMSDCQRYKCLGNAVSTNVIDAIARKLLAA